MACLLISACDRRTVTSYGPEAREEFVANCVGAGDSGRTVDVETFCDCVYARFEADVPFEVIEDLDEDPALWPLEVQQIVLDCGADAAQVGTTST